MEVDETKSSRARASGLIASPVPGVAGCPQRLPNWPTGIALHSALRKRVRKTVMPGENSWAPYAGGGKDWAAFTADAVPSTTC